MRVLVIHNFYRSGNASGENLSVGDEIAGLRELDWDVEVLSADSDVIVDGRLPMTDVALRPLYSGRSVRRTEDAIRRFRPHVALVENLFPMHSPWVLRTLAGAGVPVAAGVRSYRMWCANSAMFRDGHNCDDCVGSKLNLPAVRHGCYQNSPVRTLPLAASLAVHRRSFRTIGAYLAVSGFVADRIAAAGLPRARVVIRPNFVPDPGPPAPPTTTDFVFAGRVSEEKGVRLLLDAWERSGAWEGSRLVIAGSGELDDEVARVRPELNVDGVGLVPHDELMQRLANSAVLVLPSLWHEPFGRGVIEAAARGRPAVVTRRGGLPGLVEHGTTGWVSDPDPDALAAALAAAADPDAHRPAGSAARTRFTERYTREVSLGILGDTLDRLARDGALTA